MKEALSKHRYKVSIIIVTYNALDFVKICLDSVRRYSTMSHEILVVDNASEKPLIDYLKQQDGIRLIFNTENKLWCEGNNQGINAAAMDSTHILLLNSDMEIRRADWLQRMINVIESSSEIGLVGPAAARVRIWPTFGGIDGQCMMIKKKLIEEIGQLDCVRYPWTGGDVDFAARAFKKGYLYKVMPKDPPLALHYRGMSWRDQECSEKTGRFHKELDIKEVIRQAGLRPRPMPRFLWQIYKRLPGKPFYELTRREIKIAQGKGPPTKKYYGHKIG